MTSPATIRRLFGFSSERTPERAEIVDFPTVPHEPAQAQGRPWRANSGARIAAAIPFVVATFLSVLPGYYDPLFISPPDMLGIPAGLVFQVVTLGWAGLGLTVVWQARFPFLAALALTICSGPAVIAVALMPTLIEHMQNLV